MAGKNTVKHAFFAAVLLLAGASVLSGSYVKQYAAEPAASLTEEGPAETGDNITGDEAVVSVTDDLDREVSVPSGMIKAAALTASFAQTWLLAGGEICAAPHDAWEDLDLDLDESVTDLGKYNEVSWEMLFCSEPDLVIASAKTGNHLELKDTLEKAGIPVLYFEVNTFEDYLRMLKAVTRLTGRDDLYEENGTHVKAQVDAVIEASKGRGGDAPRILLLRTLSSGVKAKDSESSVGGLILRDLGCVNIADGSDLLEDLSLERIIVEDPDFIFILQQGNDSEKAEQEIRESLSDNPAWAELTAVKENRVFWLDRYLYQFKPNSRWGEAYEKLEKILSETF